MFERIQDLRRFLALKDPDQEVLNLRYILPNLFIPFSAVM